MKRPADIVSDAEVDRVHGYANFGPTLTKRQVVNQGVLTYAFGYTSGHTQMTILLEHGLIAKPHGYNSRLTKKGLAYLRAVFRRVQLSEIMKLAEALESPGAKADEPK